METAEIYKLISIIGFRYNPEQQEYLVNELAYTSTQNINDLVNRILDKFKRKPKVNELSKFIKNIKRPVDVCNLCKNKDDIGVPVLKFVKGTGEKFVLVPGNTIKCPKCYTSASFKNYLEQAKSIHLYEMKLKKNRVTKTYKTATEQEIQEWIKRYNEKDFICLEANAILWMYDEVIKFIKSREVSKALMEYV